MAKKSASLLAAQEKYFAENNIIVQVPAGKKSSKKGVAISITSHKVSKFGLNANLKGFYIYIGSINKAPILSEMEDSKIISILIDDYDLAINHLLEPNNFDNPLYIKDFLKKNNMHEGLCKYSRVSYGIDICEKDWIINELTNSWYWCEIPDNCYKSEDIINCLKIRVQKLKSIVL